MTMSIIGRYKHVKSENLNNFFAAVGVPLLPRKMMCMSSPELEITKENDEWTIRNASLLRTTVYKFQLNQEYEETMPNGETLKNITTLEGDNKLITNSVVVDTGIKTSRTYDFTENGCVITLYHDKEKVSATRTFQRIPSL